VFEIKSGIPVPASAAGRPSTAKVLYPYTQMMPGDSFFVAIGDKTPKQMLTRMRASLFRWRKANKPTVEGFKFRIVEIAHPDTTLPAVGVWRTS